MRTTLAICVALWTSPSLARVDLAGPNGTVFGIEDTTGGQLVAPASFVGWPRLCVRLCAACDDPCAPGDIYDAGGAPATVELNNRQRALAPQLMAGLTVQRRVFVPSAGQANANSFVRYLDALTNETAGPITVAVRIGSVAANSGRLQNGAATLWRTHSDDATIELTDRWLLTDDDDPDGGLASIGHLIFGTGARFSPSRIAFRFADPARDAALAWEYQDVTVQPGQTVIFMSTLVYEAMRDDALAEVEHLLQAQTVDLLFGLDEPTRRAIANFDVDPANAAPLADAGGPYNAAEGEQVALSAVRSFDAEGAVLQYAWDLDDDGEFDDAAGANTFITYDDDGVYPVAVRVTDPGGKTDQHRARVAVRNVAPRIDALITDSPIAEGSRLHLELRVTDPGADTLFVDVDWDGDDIYEDQNIEALQLEHRYLDDGIFDAGLRVRDDDGGMVEADFQVVVENRAPQIQQFFGTSPVLEGADVAITTVASDAGGDPIIYCYDLDNDLDYELCGPDLDSANTSFPDDGLYTIRVRITDDQDASSTREFQVSVLNARPEIRSVTNTGPVLEGSPVTIDIDATDQGAEDVLDYSFDLDNDGLFDEDVANQADPFVEHVFRQQGNHIVGVRVRDDDGSFAGGSTTVEVGNAPPTGSIAAPQFVLEGQRFEVTIDAADPGDDVLVYNYDFDGDGMFEVRNSRQPVQAHTYAQQGDFTIRVLVSDGDGGELQLTSDIVVRNEIPDLQIELQSPQPEGAEVVIRAVANDPGNDELIYSFDLDDDGVFEFEQQLDPLVRWRYPDEGRYTVRVVVDDGNDVIDARREIEITNVAPTARISANSPVNEGEEMVFTAEVDDPGSADTITLHWMIQGEEHVVAVEADEDLVLRVPALDDAIFNAELVAIDDDGGESAAARTQMIVANVPPTFQEIAFVRPATEAVPYNQIVPADDPAGPADPLRYGLIDPPAGVEIEAETGLIDWTPTFDQYLASPITLTVTVSDGDGGTDETQLVIEVLPQDEDNDGLPDTYERNTCDAAGAVCLDPSDPNDAQADPDMDGRDNLTEFEESTDPFIYEGASIPVLRAPDDGARVETLTPSFDVGPVRSDREEDDLFLVYQIFSDAALEDEVHLSDAQPQAEGADLNRYTIEAGILLEDQDYWWRAAAIGNAVQSPWSAPWRFRTNATNQPPTAPTLDAPPDQAIVASAAPTLRVLPATDPDGDALIYKFRIYRRNGAPFANGVGQLGDGIVLFDTTNAGLAENGTFLWDVVAEDEAGALSEPSEQWQFTIDTENQGPTAATIIYPEAGDLVPSLNPECIAGGARDDDDSEIGYVFRVRLQGGAEFIDESQPVLVPQGEQAKWTPTVALTEDADHTLEVHTVDDGGGASEPVSVDFFVSAIDHPPPKPNHQSPADGGAVDFDDACVTWSEVSDPEREDVSYVVTYCTGGNQCGESLPLENLGFCLGNRVERGLSYQWQVEAFDPAGNSAGRTEAWTFDVQKGSSGGGGDDGCCNMVGRGGETPWGLAALGLLLLGLRRRR